MGKTKKAIRKELETLYSNMMDTIEREEEELTREEKAELREYVGVLSQGKIHSFSPIFIRKRIRS